MTYAQLKQINEGLGQIDIKGKKYTPVTERVNGFRQGWTNGRIETQILSFRQPLKTMREMSSPQE